MRLFSGSLRRGCGFELLAHPFLEGLHVLRAAEKILNQSIGGDRPARLQYSAAIAHWSWAGEQVLVAGMCAGYPAGRPDGHHMINRSNATARYLEIGTRRDGDLAFYPDDDLMLIPTEQGTAWAHKPRRPYPPD